MPEVSKLREHSRRTRAPYASRACDECRRRKVKCSGSEPCQGCAAAETTCRYNHDDCRRRKPREAYERHHPRRIRINHSGLNRHHTLNSRDSGSDLGTLNRLSRLNCATESTPIYLPGTSSTVTNTRGASISSEELPHNVIVDDRFDHGTAILTAQVKALETVSPKSPRDRADTHVLSRNKSNPKQTLSVLPPLACCLTKTPRLAYLVRKFLIEENFCFHCVDAEDFTARLSNLLDTHAQDAGHVLLPSDRPDLIALAALTCMILAHAEYVFADVNCASKESAEGAYDLWYIEAQKIRYLYPRYYPDNIDIIRFHLMEAFYCLEQDCTVQDSIHDAPRAVSMAVTAALAIGLNNEARWSNLPQQEKLSRKCLWITLYWMDRQVAYKSGRPYLIRDNETTVSDLTCDIAELDSQLKARTNTRDEVSGANRHIDAMTRRLDLELSIDLAPFSVDTSFKLKYIQGIMNISRLFTRAWASYFSVRAPPSHEREEVSAFDASVVRVQRNLYPELSWDSSTYTLNQKPDEPLMYLESRLLLFMRLNMLRLAVHHASIRGRRGDPPLSTRYSLADCQYSLRCCEDITYATLKSLAAYLDTKPYNCLSIVITSTMLECIYHLIVVTQHAMSQETNRTLQLPGHILDALTSCVQALHRTAGSALNPRPQLSRHVLSLVEGVLSRQRCRAQGDPVGPKAIPSPAVQPTPQPSIASPIMLTSSDQIINHLSNNIPQSPEAMVFQAHAEENILTEANDTFSYSFGPGLLPASFANSAAMFDPYEPHLFPPWS
ncbi:hypothetical protein FB567DRAFT_147979 [Paraphoma chrysanthemicola]|uniref:Zn(2)-C6 fungal-type domain-containing protein n=1 Tax=Paraphoma chrysanthemicola TaxID=798071 RepID=A0A8K0QYR7_9PLEO|nr:hypothetical protein FB567DRAFT_147979 [Paraphoma chrysanthemicola]